MPAIYLLSSGFSQLSRTTLYSTVGGLWWVGRSTIVELISGVWVHVFRAATGHVATGDSRIEIAFSANQGQSWSALNQTLAGAAVTGFPVAGHSGIDVAGGCLHIAPNGDLILLAREEGTSASGGTYVWRSTNGGATWADQGKINNNNSLLMGGQAINVGSTIYATFWIDGGAVQTGPYKSTLYKSTNNGATWAHVSDISSNNTAEEALIQLKDGTLLCILRSADRTKTYMNRSSDLGLTWQGLTEVTAQFGILHRPKMRRVDGRIYLHARLFDPATITTGGWYVLWHTDDEAETWRGPYYIQSVSVIDNGYGDIMPRGDGTLYSVHYEAVSGYDTSIIQTVTAIG